MLALDLDYFLPPIEDKELYQYKILGLLKGYSKQFNKNKLYPPLYKLHQIANLIDMLYIKYQDFNEALFRGLRVSETDPEKIKVAVDDSRIENDTEVFELIKWVKPQVQATLNEGIALYEFVYENIIIEAVEPLPYFKENGYFVIPNFQDLKLILTEYYYSVRNTNNKTVKSLQIIPFIQSNLDEYKSPILNTGVRLINEYGNLNTPAIYICNTELDLPFNETILPIAKGKLLSLLNSD